MKSLLFASRNQKEILRDPLNIAFGLGFPLVLLLLFSALQANIPAEVFTMEKLAPGIAFFGLSFIALFSGMLLSKDRESSFLMRLAASPMSPADYILGYALPLLPIAVEQSVICFLLAFVLGLPVTIHVFGAILVLVPGAVLFIAFGLLAGSIFNEKQVGGICGALLTNLSAWLSGTWFDLHLVGGAFEKAAYFLPFAHGVDAAKAALAGDYAGIFPHLWWVLGYAAAVMLIAMAVFRRKMKNMGQ